MTERKIIWLKWVDPLATMIYREETEDEMLKRASQDTYLEDDDNKHDNEHVKASNLGPCVVGPNGIIPIHESNLPGKLFNFWMMHTNFDLSSESSNGTRFIDIISGVDGVETIDPFTRYRARIAIGKGFSQEEVKKNIETVISDKTESVEIQNIADRFAGIKKSLSEKYKLWVIYQTPDGNFEYFGGNTNDEIEAKRKSFLSGVQAKEVARSW